MNLTPRSIGKDAGKAASPNPPWRRFEQEVLHVLELAGYSVQHDRLVAGAQTDIIATQRVGGILTRLIVECKFSDNERPVSIDEVENFIARILVLRNQDRADHGYLVSNCGFTRNAHSAAKQTFVELLTLNDLYRRIFDFSQYAKSLTLSFKESPLSRNFIRPFMAEMLLSISEDERGAISVSRAPSRQPTDMANFCAQWIHEPNGSRICFLGDYGAGKTTFCTWLANWQAERYLEKPESEKVPILISLSRYTKAFDVKAMMTDILVNECGIGNLRLPAFEALLRRGLFLVLVDGFDEMARYVDREVRYRTISELAWLGQGESQLILTGRPSYFPTHEELIQALGTPTAKDEYEAARGALEELAEYTLYEVQPFSEDQIREFIGNVTADPQKAEHIWSRIQKTYNLRDLASRPVLLEMIVKSLPKLISTNDRAVINAARLYDIYTGAWIDREVRKGEFRKLIHKEHKLRFMEELAMQLFSEGRESINYRQLSAPIREFFQIDDADEVDFFSHDIRTCAFLRRNSSADYEFIHRSFQEFFLAKRLISDAAKGAKVSWEAPSLPPEALRFASELLVGEGRTIVDTLLKWAGEDPISHLGRNCISVASLSGRKIPERIAQSFGMPPDVLAAAATYQLGGPGEGQAFEEFVYLRAVARVRSFLNRELGAYLIDSHDIVHEEFLSVMNVLRGRPLQTASEIDALIASAIQWAWIGKKSKTDLAKARGYRDLLEGIRDPDFQWEEVAHGVSPEDAVLVGEILDRMSLIDPALESILRRYYLEGEDLQDLAADLGVSARRAKAYLIRGVMVAREILFQGIGR